MTRFLSLMLTATLLLTGCKASYKDPASYTGPKIGFGNNMAANGEDATYILLKNGQLFKRIVKSDGASEMTGLGRIDADEAKEIFLAAETNGLPTMTYNRPAKRFYYIMYFGKGATNRVVWSDDEPAPDALLALYKRLNETLPNIK